jgi:hypothetical protein
VESGTRPRGVQLGTGEPHARPRVSYADNHSGLPEGSFMRKRRTDAVLLVDSDDETRSGLGSLQASLCAPVVFCTRSKCAPVWCQCTHPRASAVRVAIRLVSNARCSSHPSIIGRLQRPFSSYSEHDCGPIRIPTCPIPHPIHPKLLHVPIILGHASGALPGLLPLAYLPSLHLSVSSRSSAPSQMAFWLPLVPLRSVRLAI